jgi:hypothetical protein
MQYADRKLFARIDAFGNPVVCATIAAAISSGVDTGHFEKRCGEACRFGD